jgi:hypothetical protein
MTSQCFCARLSFSPHLADPDQQLMRLLLYLQGWTCGKSSLPVKSTVILGRETCKAAWEGESRGRACESVSMKPPSLNAVLP